MSTIDLNQPGALTKKSVAALIASKDDSQNRQIRVSEEGIVELSDTVGNRDLEGVKFRLETLGAGNGYVGREAAARTEWVERIYKALDEHWKKGTRGYIDWF